MKCPICGDEVVQIKARDKHMVIGKNFADNHIHVHGDLHDKETMKEMLETASGEVGAGFTAQTLNRKEIVFHNRQRIGDMLMFTCGVRDFKQAFPDVRVNVISVAMHIWDNNPYIDRALVATEENTIKIGPGKLTNASNRIDWHFANAFRVSMEDALKVHIPQGESRPDIWLTEEEYNAPRVIEQPYWIMVLNGEKGWGCKMYPFERWQEFVSQNKDTTFVQLGTNEDNPPRLQGKNIIDYVGKTQDKETGIRNLFKLFLNAEGSIGLVSFHMHLSGALYKPAIVVAGAREPVSFTKYAGHQYLATDGCLPCAITACWHCDINTCTNLIEGKEKVPKCVDLIYPEDLTRALNQYYLGGRLQKGKPVEKPKLKNVVKTPEKVAIPEFNETLNPMSKYGLRFGNTCIEIEDWEFMEKTIEKYNIKSVLEFGCGLSTLCMVEKGLKVVSFETDKEWIEVIKSKNPTCDIRLWDGKTADIPNEKFDMAFVDGPCGGENREFPTKVASELTNYILIHDANRSYERKWQEKYLFGKFQGIVRAGRRIHFWGKKLTDEPIVPFLCVETPQPCTIKPKTNKYIKFVSTARGWGGCARSVTTIMKFLLKAGHKVEFIPFRNSVGSKEFQQYIKDFLPELIITVNYETVKETCDIFFIYADDYVWEFGKQEIIDAFSGLNAEKKIMMLNYRRGEVGKLPWTKGWDKYMFLNSTQEKEFLRVLPGAKTKVLPPCTELEEFFKVQPVYNKNIRLVRHNSQGDTKFSKDFNTELNEILKTRVDLEVHMLPGPSFIPENDKFRKYPRVVDVNSIINFLNKGNLFWYSLPQGYMDMGPRVVLEAMAVGLPILADNWGGVVDRVSSDCGWLCNTKEEHAKIIKNLTFEELEKKGTAARERAKSEFIPEKWIEEILNA